MSIINKIVQAALNINGIPAVMNEVKLTLNEASSVQGITFNIDIPVEYFHYFNKLYAPTVSDIPFGPPLEELVEVSLNELQQARNGMFSVPFIRVPLSFIRNNSPIEGSGEDFIRNEYNLPRIGYAMRKYYNHKLFAILSGFGQSFCAFVIYHLENIMQEYVELAFSVNDKIATEQEDRLHREFHFSNEWGGSDVKIVSYGIPEHAVEQLIAPAWIVNDLRFSNRIIRNARHYLEGKMSSRHVYAIYYDWCDNELTNSENAVLIPKYILNNKPCLRDYRKVFVKELTKFTRTEWLHMEAEMSHARRYGY